MSIKGPDLLKNPDSVTGGDVEELTNVRVIPTGEHFRVIENETLSVGALQSTSLQSLDTEHSVSSSSMVIWSLMSFMALQRSPLSGGDVGRHVTPEQRKT